MLHPLKSCLLLGICTLAHIVGRMDINLTFGLDVVDACVRSHASNSLGGHSFAHGMNTHEPSMRPRFRASPTN
jgi:hypothetical protein